AEALRQAALHLIAGALGHRGQRTAVIRVLGGMFAEVVKADLPLRAGRGDISVLRAEALTGRGVPVVEERGVLAPVDRPEEGVAQRLAANRGRPVHREKEAGCAVFLV